MQVIHTKLTRKQTAAALNEKQRTKRKHINGGATAEVYAFGPHKVLRIQETDYDYDASRYLEWAKFCLRSRSRHVPKIYLLAVEYAKHGGVVQVITVLEKLADSYTNGAIDDDDSFRFADYIMGYHSWGELEITPAAKRAFPKHAATALKKSTRKHNIWFNDLHDGNWMVRKRDGRLVITDPIC